MKRAFCALCVAMDDATQTQKPAQMLRQSKLIKATAKEERLKAALRNNLKRRKEVSKKTIIALSET
jgi:hypothetical protein